MALRSLLFVPGDRPERFAKALATGADALILDFEDAVALAAKPAAREAVRQFLGKAETTPAARLFVRVNALDSGETAHDLDALAGARLDGIMLPKAEGAASIRQLRTMLAERALALPVLPIATETASAMFELGTYREVGESLAGIAWGSEDLPVALGATSARENDGRYTPVYEVVRSLVLFAAHAAGVEAIETVFPAFRDLAGLAAYVARARRDGFTGMMAIHPDQVAVINAGFTPSEAEVAHARAVVAAFAADPEAGVLQLDGKMIDIPHLKAARRVLERSPGA